MYKIKISSHTDIGDRKETNQDSLLSRNGIINNHTVCLFVIADGCGGLKFGEEISHFIVTRFSRFWDDELQRLLPQKKINMDNIDHYLDDILIDINRKSISFGRQISDRVGSTLTMFLSVDKRYIVKNVGDSRVYLKRKNKLIQITEDQSLVADMIRSGRLTKEEAKTYKKKNILTMCIGVFDDLKIHSKRGIIKNKDVFILCSDGLYNHISDETMLEILQSLKCVFEEKAQCLRNCIVVGKANDNISSIVCGYYKEKRPLKASIILLIAALIIITILLLFKNVAIEYVNRTVEFMR